MLAPEGGGRRDCPAPGPLKPRGTAAFADHGDFPANLFDMEDQMNTLLRYEPLAGSFDGLINQLFRPAPGGDADAPRPIRLDVSETEGAYKVAAELPGVKKDQISVEIDGNEVVIAAEVTREKEANEGGKWLHSERFYGKTARRFALAHEIDQARSEAKFADGILELTLPKKIVATATRLAVQ
jgi:HSP20 family protein